MHALLQPHIKPLHCSSIWGEGGGVSNGSEGCRVKRKAKSVSYILGAPILHSEERTWVNHREASFTYLYISKFCNDLMKKQSIMSYDN